MTGRIVQVNISRGGIPKRSIPEGRVTRLGIDGDDHAHPRVHGGPRKALLMIASEAIDALISKGYPLYPGALGENLTITGIDHRQLRSGQRFRAGEALIELTDVRVPCATLDIYGPAIKQEIYDKQIKAGDPSSPRWATSGFYTSVVQTGWIRAGDIIALADQVV